MRKISNFSVFAFILICFSIIVNAGMAQTKPDITGVFNPSFELRDGDRVVFVGNSLLENDLQYGYLELALTTRWPFQDVTFRNLGWSGDTVSGNARSYITAPSAYDLLIEQIKDADPTVVFIAYGANEAFGGREDLPHFLRGLNQLLNEIDLLGARAVLLSPIPMMSAKSAESPSDRNEMLEMYTSAISEVASERDIRFIDLFNPLLEYNGSVELSHNGLHLNENGYYKLSNIILEGLGFTSRNNEILNINVSRSAIQGTVRANILKSDRNKGTVEFRIDEDHLPLPLPEAGEQIASANLVRLKIDGLKKGFYTLSTGGSEIITASAKEWKKGLEIKHGVLFDRANQLRENIIKKNGLFFHQYRPLNRTYIIGFRSHEQGRHAEGLEDLSIIITWLEGQIALNRVPVPQFYQLKPTR